MFIHQLRVNQFHLFVAILFIYVYTLLFCLYVTILFIYAIYICLYGTNLCLYITIVFIRHNSVHIAQFCVYMAKFRLYITILFISQNSPFTVHNSVFISYSIKRNYSHSESLKVNKKMTVKCINS